MARSGFLLAIVFLLLTLVVAQNETQALPPTCALICFNEYIPLSTCAPTNTTCICTNADLRTQLSACIRSNCTVKEGLTTQNLTSTTCGAPIRDRSKPLRDTVIAFICITTIFVAARTIARLPYFGSQLGIDDAFILTSWALALALSVDTIISTEIGFGRDIWTVPFNHITEILEFITIDSLLYFTATWFTKISILLQYLRLFPDENFRFHVKILLIFSAAATFATFWAYFFRCWPMSYSWNGWDGEHKGTCVNYTALAWSTYLVNTFADCAVLLLPIPSIWKLNLALGKKLRVVFMFSIGLFATLIALIRIGSIKGFATSTNVTWDFVALAIWSCIEVYLGIICACLPGMQNFTTRVFYGKILKSVNGSTSRFSPGASHNSERIRRKMPVRKDNTTLMMTDLSSGTNSTAYSTTKESEPEHV